MGAWGNRPIAIQIIGPPGNQICVGVPLYTRELGPSLVNLPTHAHTKRVRSASREHLTRSNMRETSSLVEHDVSPYSAACLKRGLNPKKKQMAVRKEGEGYLGVRDDLRRAPLAIPEKNISTEAVNEHTTIP